MANFYDADLNLMTYWPIPTLKENDISPTIIVQLIAPRNGYLRASLDARARVWAKWMQFPLNPFINISAGSGINLNGIPGPYAVFQIYVEALSPIVGMERVPLTVMATESDPAGWSD